MIQREKGNLAMEDPITFEIIRHRLWQINDEQGVTVNLISGSPIITESNDFNIAIMNSKGDQIFLGSFYTRNAAPLDLVVKYTLQNRSNNPGIFDGDMFLNNDPWIGSIHQQDVMVFAPVFWEDKIIFWTGCNLHHIDMGGSRPGGFIADAKTRFEEPPIFPVLKVVENGTLRKDMEELFMRHSRTPELANLDLKALIAGNAVAGKRLKELVARYGIDTVTAVQQRIISNTSRLFKKRLTEFPDGKWSKTLFIEHYKEGRYASYPLKLTLKKEGDKLIFDFTGTAKQAQGFVNCTFACTRASIIANVLPSLCYDMPWTPAGIWDSIEIICEPDTLNNASDPSSVSMASVAAGRCTTEVVQACLARMLGFSEAYRTQASAGWGGGYIGTVIAGTDRFGSKFTGIIETARGSGATMQRDGVDCGDHFDMPKRRMPNVEAMEHFYPILYLWNRMEPDSCGAGKFRGGLTNSFAWIPHGAQSDLTLNVISFGVIHPQGSGLFGGAPANTNRAILARNCGIKKAMSLGKLPQSLEDLSEGTEENSPSTNVTSVGANDLVFTISSGGGGSLDPLERDPKAVAKDLAEGFITIQTAREIYGLVNEPETFKPDLEATVLLRDQMKKQRISDDTKLLDGDEIRHLIESEIGSPLFCSKCKLLFSLDAEDSDSLQAIGRKTKLQDAGLLINPYESDESRNYELCEVFCPKCKSRIETFVILNRNEKDLNLNEPRFLR